ncbi:MAG: glycerol-3-phosphate 1-O-acyltransferase PlsY [Lachnospiraceae bacterium]|nr:glycerol-3-phosphate 1-O-acyltransferase PlsY [Lachnospiraceae bacterium]
MLEDIIKCLLVGYLFGCISTSYLIGKLYNIDIREHGSGNAGTTNTMRVLGKKAGIMVYLGDCIKCAIAILIMISVLGKKYESLPNATDMVQLIKLVTGFGAVLGHNYPFWLKFKGGKGIAVTSAVIIIFCLPADWYVPIICIIAFTGIFRTTRYVSLGSLTVITMFLLYVAIAYTGSEVYGKLLFFTFLFTASGFYTHKSNIKRLMNGTENKLEKVSDKKMPVNNNINENNMNNNVNNNMQNNNMNNMYNNNNNNRPNW